MTDLVSVTPWPSKYRGVGVTTLETEGRIAVEDPKETGARERSDPGGMGKQKKREHSMTETTQGWSTQGWRAQIEIWETQMEGFIMQKTEKPPSEDTRRPEISTETHDQHSTRVPPIRVTKSKRRFIREGEYSDVLCVSTYHRWNRQYRRWEAIVEFVFQDDRPGEPPIPMHVRLGDDPIEPQLPTHPTQSAVLRTSRTLFGFRRDSNSKAMVSAFSVLANNIGHHQGQRQGPGRWKSPVLSQPYVRLTQEIRIICYFSRY
jgi:hypothetical protein